jgi:hypothetical protein
MKTSSLKKNIVLGAAVTALALVPSLHAALIPVTVFIEGGSASQSVLYDRATNLFTGGTFTSTGNGKSTVRQFVGTSGNPALANLNITLDINVNNGAIAGLQALINQTPGPGDTNVLGAPEVPTFVDSATSPDAVGIDSVAANLTAYPTYVVPLVYVKNSAWTAIAGITNLTQRQAVSLETSVNPATYYGASTTNLVYFVGRNSQAAVRTELDLNIYNSANITTFTNNSNNLPVQDQSADPGLTSGGTVATVVAALTNSIGTVAVQNITGTLVPLAYEGVNYSVTNVINGSYPLWGYENYYFITAPNNGAPTTTKQAVLDAFYSGVTNATFQVVTNPTFTNSFVPLTALKVSRGFDGGQISPLPNY